MKAKAKAKAFDPAEWTRQGRIKHGPACEACTRPGVRDALRAMLNVMARGEGRRSLREIHEILVQQYGYRNGKPGVGEHLRNHERELWDAAQKAC